MLGDYLQLKGMGQSQIDMILGTGDSNTVKKEMTQMEWILASMPEIGTNPVIGLPTQSIEPPEHQALIEKSQKAKKTKKLIATVGIATVGGMMLWKLMALGK